MMPATRGLRRACCAGGAQIIAQQGQRRTIATTSTLSLRHKAFLLRPSLVEGGGGGGWWSDYYNKETTCRSFQTTARRDAPSSPFDPKASPPASSSHKKTTAPMIPRKAAVKLTEGARTFFQRLLQDPPRPDVIGIRLNFAQSTTGQPRMVFTFSFVTAAELGSMDEGVSLEVVQDPDNGSSPTTPRSPADAAHDGLPKLYVAGNAFLKVLGATVDVDTAHVSPVLYDREGNLMDPNS